jgi:hypothetical protein
VRPLLIPHEQSHRGKTKRIVGYVGANGEEEAATTRWKTRQSRLCT